MIKRIRHRGPDGQGFWSSADNSLGFGHARLAIIDTSSAASQPMIGRDREVITYSGEIYNYKELRAAAALSGRRFNSSSDTEAILATYELAGVDFLNELRGMFAFAIWDPQEKRLLLARDRFGIKPLYYAVVADILYFASEAKAILPFMNKIETNHRALTSYLYFQNYPNNETLFEGINQLLPGHYLTAKGHQLEERRYWDISYEIDFSHTASYFIERTRELMIDSIEKHARSDVEISSYLSGGIDSSLVSSLAVEHTGQEMKSFHGRYLDYKGYDESAYAQAAADHAKLKLSILDLSSRGVIETMRKVSYHLDFPVAGPGALPQYAVSEMASNSVKVVLGGQGGDEIFGGYARYLIGYLEQCLKGAIEGTSKNGNFLVTLESISPNLGVLQEYTPLLQKLLKHGLFDDMGDRYFNLIEKASDLHDAITFNQLPVSFAREEYASIFYGGQAQKKSYFDLMTHYDTKALLPGLLQVEDRMSMAHGLESRVPLLDHHLVEFVTTIPADIKFKNGELKRLLKIAFPALLPGQVLNRRDKVGFPVPLTEWSKGPLKADFHEIIAALRDRQLSFINCDHLSDALNGQAKFSRGLWALLNLELWHQEFHDSHLAFDA